MNIELFGKDVIRICKEEDVKFIRLFFADITGQMKGFSIPVEELENAPERCFTWKFNRSNRDSRKE